MEGWSKAIDWVMPGQMNDQRGQPGTRRRRAALAAACAAALAVPLPAEDAVEPLRVVATTALIGSAIAELGLGGLVEVEELIPPGSCPGHFDLTPGAMRNLRESGLLIHHDFQDGLAKRLRAGHAAAEVLRLETRGSLAVPANFRQLVGAVADGIEPHLDHAGRARLRVSRQAAEERLGALDSGMKEAATRWEGRAVVVSAMQREFVENLGMKVVGELGRPEQMTPRDWHKLAGAKAALIVGNLQSDAPAAQALGRRSGLPVAVLSNFPGAEGFGQGFEDLFRANLARLDRAVP